MDEIDALKAIDSAFSSLDADARVRTLSWIAAKYSLGGAVVSPANIVEQGEPTGKSTQIKLTAKAVATHLGASSGPELLYAAAAHLGVVLGKETMTRQELLATMKSATGYYKPTYNNNLSSYLDGLCKKGILIEVAAQSYTVKASELTEMQQKLSNAG